MVPEEAALALVAGLDELGPPAADGELAPAGGGHDDDEEQ